ncbi:MAG TPA: macro domain-containing protein [Chthonomonadaceae bacterium]|nr:macro domain-containing protein [Chthonomonadaceae bacterium]
MRGGGGVDGAIHVAAGPELMQELRRVVPHSCPPGEAVITHGHRLKQPWIIHTPGPVWNGGDQNEDALLASSYRRCLEVAEEHGLRSVAFCSISTGAYRFPLDRAAGIAVNTVQQYLRTHPETGLSQIVFAMYRAEEYQVFQHALDAGS